MIAEDADTPGTAMTHLADVRSLVEHEVRALEPSRLLLTLLDPRAHA